jgi:hypothetical protein
MSDNVTKLLQVFPLLQSEIQNFADFFSSGEKNLCLTEEDKLRYHNLLHDFSVALRTVQNIAASSHIFSLELQEIFKCQGAAHAEAAFVSHLPPSLLSNLTAWSSLSEKFHADATTLTNSLNGPHYLKKKIVCLIGAIGSLAAGLVGLGAGIASMILTFGLSGPIAVPEMALMGTGILSSTSAVIGLIVTTKNLHYFTKTLSEAKSNVTNMKNAVAAIDPAVTNVENQVTDIQDRVENPAIQVSKVQLDQFVLVCTELEILVKEARKAYPITQQAPPKTEAPSSSDDQDTTPATASEQKKDCLGIPYPLKSQNAPSDETEK